MRESLVDTPSELQILVVNPGGTSTKVAWYVGGQERWHCEVRHPGDELRGFSTLAEQLPWRLKAVRDALGEAQWSLEEADAVVGRGGPVAPVPGGTFVVDDAMLQAIADERVMVVHPSLLGAPMAAALAAASGCPAYISDPVSVDELDAAARLTGLPSIQRRPLAHTLSIKATAYEVAQALGRGLEEVRLVILHLGSGTSVAAQRHGHQVDATDASASGPMAPTRAGSLPALDFARLCFSGAYTLADVERMLVREGGWVAHLGTDDVREIYRRVDDGDADAALVLEATILHLAKETAGMAAVLGGRVDAIAITGGVARSERFVDALRPGIEWICPRIFVYPGEREMLALARGATRVMEGESEPLFIGPYLRP